MQPGPRVHEIFLYKLLDSNQEVLAESSSIEHLLLWAEQKYEGDVETLSIHQFVERKHRAPEFTGITMSLKKREEDNT